MWRNEEFSHWNAFYLKTWQLLIVLLVLCFCFFWIVILNEKRSFTNRNVLNEMLSCDNDSLNRCAFELPWTKTSRLIFDYYLFGITKGIKKKTSRCCSTNEKSFTSDWEKDAIFKKINLSSFHHTLMDGIFFGDCCCRQLQLIENNKW